MMPSKSVNAQKRHQVANPHSYFPLGTYSINDPFSYISSLLALSTHPITQISITKKTKENNSILSTLDSLPFLCFSSSFLNQNGLNLRCTFKSLAEL